MSNDLGPIKCANCEREGRIHYCYSVEEMKAHLKEHREREK